LSLSPNNKLGSGIVISKWGDFKSWAEKISTGIPPACKSEKYKQKPKRYRIRIKTLVSFTNATLKKKQKKR